MFFAPGKKETLVPGIDIYADETVFIYNSERPDYWLPVTIKEVFEAWLEYYKYEPNKYTSDLTLKILQEQYTKFSEEEKNKPAYYGGRGSVPLLTVDVAVSDKQLMRHNPKYWNKNLSRSDIQILSFDVLKDRERYRKEAKEQLKNDDGNYHVSRFLEALDLESLLVIIDE